MNVEVHIRVTNDRMGESPIDMDLTEVFRLEFRRKDQSHDDRSLLLARIEEHLIHMGIRNSGTHG